MGKFVIDYVEPLQFVPRAAIAEAAYPVESLFGIAKIFERTGDDQHNAFALGPVVNASHSAELVSHHHPVLIVKARSIKTPQVIEVGVFADYDLAFDILTEKVIERPVGIDENGPSDDLPLDKIVELLRRRYVQGPIESCF